MLWVKAFHIFFVVSWFAGIFYLPRLFVNLAMVSDAKTAEHLLLMANKLYRFMMPWAVLSVVFGVWLVLFNPDYFLRQTWMYAKLALVAFLVVYHFVCGRFLNQFNRGVNCRSHVYYRWFNEAPVIVLIGVCILVVVKPF